MWESVKPLVTAETSIYILWFLTFLHSIAGHQLKLCPLGEVSLHVALSNKAYTRSCQAVDNFPWPVLWACALGLGAAGSRLRRVFVVHTTWRNHRQAQVVAAVAAPSCCTPDSPNPGATHARGGSLQMTPVPAVTCKLGLPQLRASLFKAF